MGKNIFRIILISVLSILGLTATNANVDQTTKKNVDIECNQDTGVSTVTITFKSGIGSNHKNYIRKYHVTGKGSFTIPGSITSAGSIEIPGCKCVDSNGGVEIIEAFAGENFNGEGMGALSKNTKDDKAVNRKGCGNHEKTRYFPGLNYWSDRSSGSYSSELLKDSKCKFEDFCNLDRTVCVTTTKMTFVRDAETCNMPEIDGVCDNETVNSCNNGTFSDLNDSDDKYLWKCLGVNGGEDSVICEKEKPKKEEPRCSIKHNGCDIGSSNDIADTIEHYKWECTKDNITITCEEPMVKTYPAQDTDAIISGDIDTTLFANNNLNITIHSDLKYKSYSKTTWYNENNEIVEEKINENKISSYKVLINGVEIEYDFDEPVSEGEIFNGIRIANEKIQFTETGEYPVTIKFYNESGIQEGNAINSTIKVIPNNDYKIDKDTSINKNERSFIITDSFGNKLKDININTYNVDVNSSNQSININNISWISNRSILVYNVNNSGISNYDLNMIIPEHDLNGEALETKRTLTITEGGSGSCTGDNCTTCTGSDCSNPTTCTGSDCSNPTTCTGSDCSNNPGTNPGLKIIGSTQFSGMNGPTDVSTINTNRQIKQNAEKAIKGMTNGKIVNGVLYINDSITKYSDIKNKVFKTVVIKNGNLNIDENIENTIGIILINDDSSDKTIGNIIVAPDVNFINAAIYTENKIKSDLDKQLVFFGSLFTQNTKDELAGLRNGNKGWLTTDINNNGKYDEGDDQYNYRNKGFDDNIIVEYNPILQQNPPKCFGN